ncbi:MAG: hypothetical protein E7582_06215 [Ruminococcaceae bacterium]|nr:hypothetical protein [Oscillospiraceae bacterium]
MKKIVFLFLLVTLSFLAVGCHRNSVDIPDNIYSNGEEQPPVPDDFEEFFTAIFLYDDVYRSDDTLTWGSGTICLPMSQEILELKDYKILLCDNECELETVVSLSAQGYASVHNVELAEEIDGNFKTFRFKMVMLEQMANAMKEQGVYDNIVEEIEGQYYYLLELDEKCYAYIHLERKEGLKKGENEAEIANFVVKNARVSFELKQKTDN